MPRSGIELTTSRLHSVIVIYRDFSSWFIQIYLPTPVSIYSILFTLVMVCALRYSTYVYQSVDVDYGTSRCRHKTITKTKNSRQHTPVDNRRHCTQRSSPALTTSLTPQSDHVSSGGVYAVIGDGPWRTIPYHHRPTAECLMFTRV